jgi:hypothetical protein
MGQPTTKQPTRAPVYVSGTLQTAVQNICCHCKRCCTVRRVHRLRSKTFLGTMVHTIHYPCSTGWTTHSGRRHQGAHQPCLAKTTRYTLATLQISFIKPPAAPHAPDQSVQAPTAVCPTRLVGPSSSCQCTTPWRHIQLLDSSCAICHQLRCWGAMLAGTAVCQTVLQQQDAGAGGACWLHTPVNHPITVVKPCCTVAGSQSGRMLNLVQHTWSSSRQHLGRKQPPAGAVVRAAATAEPGPSMCH